MRRLEDGHAQRPPPFRVLAAPDYLSPTAIPPPPPRAPEPYKIAPSSTSSSRAHRRSSFVIIADSRPGSPETRSPSPTLATGRVSPFRGRGFKGPPPRSRSRPQSPEIARRGRNERRGKIYLPFSRPRSSKVKRNSTIDYFRNSQIIYITPFENVCGRSCCLLHRYPCLFERSM